MKFVIRILGSLVGVVVILTVALFVAGRFSDGPLGFFSGGPFSSGEPAAAPADWAFAADVDTVELQLLDPARSRTVWIVVEDGVAYIPCGIPNFRLWKQWPHEAVADGRAEVRIDGKRYPVKLSKTEGRELFERLLAKVGGKYSSAPEADPAETTEDMVWFFRLDPRPAA